MQSSTPAAESLRVFVVEDSPQILERMRALLAPVARIVGSTGSADEAIRQILEERPDAVVLDLNLAQGTGIDVLRAVGIRAPAIEVFVFTNFPNPQYRRLCMKLGAKGFFDKSTEFGQVRDAIAERAAHQVH